MLSIYYGDMPDAIYNTSVYFKNTYLDSWFDDDFARRMIKSVDKSRVIGDALIESPVLGKIAPTQLSGGVKTLLLIHNVEGKVFNASTCGNNCAWWILRMASKRDITINLRHCMDFGNGKFSIRVLNSGRVVHDMMELMSEAYEALHREVPEIGTWRDDDYGPVPTIAHSEVAYAEDAEYAEAAEGYGGAAANLSAREPMRGDAR